MITESTPHPLKPYISANSTKLSPNQRLSINDSPFQSKYYSTRKAQYESNCDYFLNLSKLLYDRELDSLGPTKILSVSIYDWKSIANTSKQFRQCNTKQINTEKALWESFAQWMKSLLQSKDAQCFQGQKLLKSRVSNLYDTLISSSKNNKIQLLELIKEHSEVCPDGAVVGLERAETLAQLVNANEHLMPNLFVLAFKRHLITAELVPQNNSEASESYLFYTLLLNKVLGLKIQSRSMHHSHIAIKYPLKDIINKIFQRLTIEDLIGFISNNETFRKQIIKENYPCINLEQLNELQIKMDLLNLDDPNLQPLYNRYEKLTDDLYTGIARQFLIQKGFITKDINYEDPCSFPTINIISSSTQSHTTLNSSTEEINKLSQLSLISNICFIVISFFITLILIFLLIIIKPFLPNSITRLLYR